MNISVWRRAALVSVLLAASSSAVIAGSNEGKQWLQHMLENARSLNYKGVFVYVQGPNLEVMSIVHSGDGDKQRQHLVALNGAVREVTVAGEEVICSLPGQQIAFNTSKYKRSPIPISLPQDLDGLEQSYRFEEKGEDRVANRVTRIISIEPRDNLRFGYRLWLDRETGMVLRSALLDDQGKIREQFVFTEFEVVNQVAQDLLKPQFISARKLATKISGNMFSEVILQPVWQAGELPSGFHTIVQQRSPDSTAGEAAEHIVFSDGLAAVSVFVEKIQDEEPLLEGPTSMDAMSAYGVVMDGYQVIAVGEVPQRTVEQIARAMQRIE